MFDCVLGIKKNLAGTERKISVKTMIVDRDCRYFARITFSDTGPGILIRNPDDIFLSFFSSKNDTGKNMGLGLSVSYGIIKKYNGSLELKFSLYRHKNHQWLKIYPIISTNLTGKSCLKVQKL